MADGTRDERRGAAASEEKPAGAAEGKTSDREQARFLPVGVLRDQAAAWVGMALLFAWTDLLFCFEGVLRDTEVMKGGLVHDPLFLCACIAASLVLLVAAMLRRPRRTRRAPGPDATARRGATVAVCCVGAACAAGAVLLASMAPNLSPALSVLAGAGVGACIGWCSLAWGGRCARLDLRAALLIVSAASCAQWLPFVALFILPTAAKAVLVAALPLASGALLLRTEAQGTEAGEASTPPNRQPASARGTVRRGTGRSPALARLSLAMAVFSCVVQFVWCYFIKMLPGRLDVGLFPAVFVVVTAVSALVMGLCARAMHTGGSYRLELYHRATFAFCLCGVAATAVAATSSSMAELFASYALVYVGYSLVGPTMWMLALGYASMRRDDARKVLGTVLAGQYLGLFVGFAADELLARSPLAGQGPQIMPTVAFVLVAMLVVAYTALFPERDLLSLSPLLFGMSHESVALRCEALAREHDLTPRETEVLALLARGRDVGYICDELSIARNTVNAHRKSIYAKLGVHSQQELLSAVEEAQA